MLKHLIIFALLFTTPGFAQDIKFKDLIPMLDGMSKEEVKNALKKYIAEDLDHPNANFRLAMMYESNYRTADLLTRFDYVIANATQAKLRYAKAKQLVTEREVSRNNEFYFPIFKTYDSKGNPEVEFEPVSRKMTNGYDSAGLTITKAPEIYRSFTRSVNFYDNAVKIFSAVNNQFLTLDDLYLYYDEDLDRKMSALKLNYDSGRFYFDKYMELTKTFPIPFHKHKYHVKHITTYRLDGLITRMNFLTNDVEFWDYGAWVESVRKSVTADIVSLRTRLKQNEQKMDENLAKIAASNGEGVAPVVLEKQLVFNLNNFDRQSLVLALLEYKSFKQDWLIRTKTYIPDTVNTDRNATIYSALIYANRTADSLINVVRERATKDKIRKHKEFLTEVYGGAEGIHKYIEAEHEFIRVTYEQYTGGLRTSVLNIATQPAVAGGPDKFVRFGKMNIPLSIKPATPELLAKGEPVTLAARKGPDGSIYVSGIYKPDKKTNLTVTFVAHVAADGKPAWVQNFNYKVDSLGTLPDAHNTLGPFELTPEGCAFIVHSVHATQPTWQNSFVYLNEKGELKFRVRLKETDYVREINYIEKSNSFVLLLKGQQEVPDFNSMETVHLIGVNALGDIQWKRQVSFAGTVADFINLADGYMLIGNYQTLKDHTGKELKTNPGESRPFLVRFTDRGDMEKVEPLPSAKSVYITNVVKVTDKSINLVGLEGNFDLVTRKLTHQDSPSHIMADRMCRVIASNLGK